MTNYDHPGYFNCQRHFIIFQIWLIIVLNPPTPAWKLLPPRLWPGRNREANPTLVSLAYDGLWPHPHNPSHRWPSLWTSKRCPKMDLMKWFSHSGHGVHLFTALTVATVSPYFIIILRWFSPPFPPLATTVWAVKTNDSLPLLIQSIFHPVGYNGRD